MADTSQRSSAESGSAPRTPPHDVQAEMGVIGSMLLSSEAIYLARERLGPESFYKLAHQGIFRAIVDLADENNAVDIILLRDELSRQDKLEKVGGISYLMELMDAVPTSANAEHYIEIVRTHAVRRHLIETASSIQKDAYRNTEDVDDLLDRAEADMLAVRDKKDSGSVRDMHEVLQNIIERLDLLHQNPGQLTGLASGYYDLDDMTGGFQEGQFLVLAARPSMGKTSLALNMLHNITVVQRKPALLYSLEMPAEQLVSNFLCIHNRLDTHDFRRGNLSDKQWGRLESSLDELVGLPLYIDDSPSLRVLDIRARARRMANRHDIQFVVVDYLQLITPNSTSENRTVAVSQISQGLKALARELEVPLLAVAQLSRRVEQEQRRPRMSDLRESGAIEQDADVIMMLHRPQEFSDDDGPGSGNEADLILTKQRNGPTGVCNLTFLRKYLRFESRASTHGLE